MTIVPYKVIFDLPTSKEDPYSRPEMKKSKKNKKEVACMVEIPITTSKEGSGYYEVEGYDGVPQEKGKKRESFYHLAFRIEDPFPYDESELSLHLDSSLREGEGGLLNDLVQDPTDKRLWYQLSQYKKKTDKNGKELPGWISIEDEDEGKRSYHVTSCGVFQAVVTQKRPGGGEREVYRPEPLFVLPKTITREDYLYMVADLIRLEEALVRKEENPIGLGGMTLIQSQTERLKEEMNINKRLLRLVKKVMVLPSELLGKEYAQVPVQNLRHFDGRVVQSYIRGGMGGKVQGIQYVINNDTYENRVIKYVLERLIRYPVPSYDPGDASMNIDVEVERQYRRLTQGMNRKVLTLYLSGGEKGAGSGAEGDGITKVKEPVLQRESGLLEAHRLFVENDRLSTFSEKEAFYDPFFWEEREAEEIWTEGEGEGEGEDLESSTAGEEAEDLESSTAGEDEREDLEAGTEGGELRRGKGEEKGKGKGENGGKRAWGLRFYCLSRAELLFFIEIFSRLYEEREEAGEISLECDRVQEKKIHSTGRSYIEVHGVSSIRVGETLYQVPKGEAEEPDFVRGRAAGEITKSASEPSRQVETMFLEEKTYQENLRAFQEEGRIQLVKGSFTLTYLGMYDPEMEEKKEEIRASLKERQSYARTCLEYEAFLKELSSVYKNPWFKKIKSLPYVSKMKRTTKFVCHSLYSQVYDTIRAEYRDHPVLEASFDQSVVGMNRTTQIYEYWVYLLLLRKLQVLGFHLQEGDRQTLLEDFQGFIRKEGASGHRLRMVKEEEGEGFQGAGREGKPVRIELEVGYEYIFKVGEDIRQPDYFLCVEHEKSRHWYFLDAKFKLYSRDGKGGYESYIKELKNISIKKYILDMQGILDKLYLDKKNEIRGSFLGIVQSTDARVPIQVSDRLFGGDTPWKEGKKEEKDQSGKGDTANQELDTFGRKPCHRYGVIVLSPSHQQELTTLLQLIFEYLETDFESPSYENPNLIWCWNCGSRMDKKKIQTKTGYFKYYATCSNPNCNAFRVDSHCIKCHRPIIKHIDANYHLAEEDKKWAFLCPQCGDGMKARSWTRGDV